jgi:hypothetical protein
VIKVTFAAERPQGAYALAVPVRSEDMLHDRLAGLDKGARVLAERSAEAQRFEREVGAIAEATRSPAPGGPYVYGLRLPEGAATVSRLERRAGPIEAAGRAGFEHAQRVLGAGL